MAKGEWGEGRGPTVFSSMVKHVINFPIMLGVMLAVNERLFVEIHNVYLRILAAEANGLHCVPYRLCDQYRVHVFYDI